MVKPARTFLAALCVMLALPAVRAHAALDRAQFEAALLAARDYADDRSLIFYCLRASTETAPFLYAGLQADIEQAVQKMKAAGATSRQTAEMVQIVLTSVRFYSAAAPRDDSLDRRCISKDVDRSRADATGVSLPLAARSPFDKFGGR